MKSYEPWIRSRYHILLEEFGDKKFTKQQALKVLFERGKPLQNLNEFFAILEQDGLIEKIKSNKIFYYKLKKLRDRNVKITKDELFRILKTAADYIRGGTDYRMLLILVFYKALSDKWKEKVEEFLKQNINKEDAFILANNEYYILYDEESDELYTWDEAIKDKTNLVKRFIESLNKISELNNQLRDISFLVDKIGFTSFLSNEDNYHIFVDLVELFNKIDFSKSENDLIGDAYEWILGYFAPTLAKQGEIYTPREVIKLMVRILDIKPNSSVLDPACGSGAMLIEAYNYVNDKKKLGKTLFLQAQERNNTMVSLAKINLLMHGIMNFEIYEGDSLTNPRFEQADYVIANPPWNLDGYDESKLNVEGLKEIYHYGFPPKQSADWLWIQLMLYYAKDKVAVVLDNGALFRSAREQKIRAKVVDDDKIEAIILLPDKLFYNTGAPGIIIILNHHKSDERKNKILFINASKEHEKHPEVRKLNRLSDKNIEKIVNVYREFKEIEGFSRIVDLDEIRKNDYNLNVTLYVYPEEEEEQIDVMKEWHELRKIEEEVDKIEEKIEGYLEELGY